jgi:TonB-dependent SusC/RagA subfamily outer membrane receptor
MSLRTFFSRLTSIIFLIALPFLVWSQEQISGKVISQSDQTVIPAVSVFVKGTSTGTKTANDGTYSIKASKGDIIVFSGVGMRQKEIVVGDQTFIDVELEVDPRALNEVVVTALGIKKETKRLGYSVQEVKGADLVKAREANPVNGLAGKIAGLNVGINQEMLAAPTVLLRGSPLNFYVVDGIPINSDTWNISPDDIETYTVLKGPTAAALFGSRGINGAILITTKRGKKNSKGFTVELNTSLQMNKGLPDLCIRGL